METQEGNIIKTPVNGELLKKYYSRESYIVDEKWGFWHIFDQMIPEGHPGYQKFNHIA